MNKSDADLAHSDSHFGRAAIKREPIRPAEESGLSRRVTKNSSGEDKVYGARQRHYGQMTRDAFKTKP